jgi:cyclic beta-1,2-glucan synthetase
MYRAGLEWLLGFRLRGDTLLIDPCIPRSWPRFEIAFHYRSARYTLVVENPQGLSRGVSSVTVDGADLGAGGPLKLADDGATHSIRVVLG